MYNCWELIFHGSLTLLHIWWKEALLPILLFLRIFVQWRGLEDSVSLWSKKLILNSPEKCRKCLPCITGQICLLFSTINTTSPSRSSLLLTIMKYSGSLIPGFLSYNSIHCMCRSHLVLFSLPSGNWDLGN